MKDKDYQYLLDYFLLLKTAHVTATIGKLINKKNSFLRSSNTQDMYLIVFPHLILDREKKEIFFNPLQTRSL